MRSAPPSLSPTWWRRYRAWQASLQAAITDPGRAQAEHRADRQEPTTSRIAAIWGQSHLCRRDAEQPGRRGTEPRPGTLADLDCTGLTVREGRISLVGTQIASQVTFIDAQLKASPGRPARLVHPQVRQDRPPLPQAPPRSRQDPT